MSERGLDLLDQVDLLCATGPRDWHRSPSHVEVASSATKSGSQFQIAGRMILDGDAATVDIT